MYKLFSAIVFAVLLSCESNEGGYLKHDLDYEKIGEDCSAAAPGLKVTANTIGERYEFQTCLDAAGNIECSVGNSNDTVRVRFRETPGPQALYQVVLDINTRPQYKYITIDSETFAVAVSRP